MVFSVGVLSPPISEGRGCLGPWMSSGWQEGLKDGGTTEGVEEEDHLDSVVSVSHRNF